VKDSLSRRSVIINLLTLPVVAGAMATTTVDASAAATTDPKTAAYQTKPKNGQQCSTCSLYVPAKMNPAKANGTCKLVKGAIAPQGWCKFYSKKS
jgi:high potential iron-sulfur protein